MPTLTEMCAGLARMEMARAETAAISTSQPPPYPGAMSQGNPTFPVDRGICWGENLVVQSQASPTRRKAVGGNEGGGL